MRAALASADIVFLDPDNGLGDETGKHATLAEVRSLRRPGRSLVLISFPNRNGKHVMQVQRLHDRLSAAA
jgi:hypothetical protein